MRASLYIAIVKHGYDGKLIKLAHDAGLTGATVLMGQGTFQHGLLGFLGLNEARKDIILMAAEEELGDVAITKIAETMHMEKPNHGIIFSIRLQDVFGAKQFVGQIHQEKRKETMTYQAIFTIVDKGNAEEVIDAVCAVGATGGTIINARGAGIHETQKVFNIPIEPEKEMVMIIAKSENVDRISQAIVQDLKIDEPGNGIIFIMDIAKIHGLYDQNA